MIYVLGSDISHHNETNLRAKLQTIKDEGYKYVYIKVSEGTGWVDHAWRSNKALAERMGFKVGPYHWLSPHASGIVQAAHHYNQIKDELWNMKPMLDVEESYSGSKSVYAARVRAFSNELQDLQGDLCIIYTSKSKWDQYVDTYVPNELFVAHWTTRPQPVIPRKWEGRGYKMWQFMIESGLDRDRFNGTWEEFLRWMGETPPVGDLEARVADLELEIQELKDWIHSY